MRLVLTVPFVFGLATCRGPGAGDPSPAPSTPAPARPVSFTVDPEVEGLRVKLYDAGDSADAVERPPVAAAEPLSDAAIQVLLGRVPPLEAVHGDRRTFALRSGSPPPPLPGSDTREPFPPPDARGGPPPVARGPLHVVRHMPDGDVPMAPHVSVTFDQPMVAVTSQAEAAKTVPVKLAPEPAGGWRWLGTKTLLFDPDPRLPMATEYTVTVPKGTRSATGSVLEADASFTFRTPPPTLAGSWPRHGPFGLEPVGFLVFDQAVDPAAVLANVELTGGPGAVALRLATPEEVAADEAAKSLADEALGDRTVAFRAVEPLPRNTHFTIRVKQGTPSREGPRTTQGDQWGSFFTYAPLAVEYRHCWWQEPCPPTAYWTIQMNNPLDPARFDAAAVRVTPEVPGLSVQMGGSTIQVSGAFQGRTTYTVTLPAALQDTFGQTLGQPQDVVFVVGPAERTLTAPGDMMVVLDPKGDAKLPLFSTNEPRLVVQVNAVDPSDWDDWRRWLEKFHYDDARPRPLPGRPVHRGTIVPPAKADAQVESALDFGPWLKDGRGQFVVLVEPANQPRDRWDRRYVYKWVQVTDLGLQAFVDGDRIVGWATDLATGASKPGVKLELLPVGDHTETGADGLGSLDLPGSAPDALLVARDGTDLVVLPESPTPWGGSSWVKESDLDQLRWYVADDRGLYRPGETAKVKGWVRRWQPGPQGDVAPFGATGEVAWVLTGSQGNEMGKGTVPLSGLGGFELELALPPDANLGTSTLLLTAEGWSTSHPLRIEEFRRPEFEVTATMDEGPHLLGEDAVVDLAAVYFAGGSLPASEVTWNVYADDGAYVPPGWSGWSFGTYVPWWRWEAPGANGAPVATFTGTTGGAGDHHLGVHFESLLPPRPMNVRAEGTVMDVNRQAWTATARTVLHPSRSYVGLKTAKSFVEKGEPIEVEVALVDLDGQALGGTEAALELARMEWGQGKDGKWGQGAVDPQPCAAKAAADGKATCTFETVRGGEYRVIARVVDAEGRPNESELRVWVSGAELPPARTVELEPVVLVPEKQELQPGEVARILVQSPFVPAEGTLTVRRSGIERLERFRMEAPTQTVEVAITEAHVPDLTVQVDLVGEARRTDDAGKPRDDLPKRVAHATGAVTFQVPPKTRTLAVTAVPADVEVRPGGTTSIALEVTGPDGKPVAGAEVAVVVADESVLALTGYRLPDPVEVFYAARGPGVRDYRARSFVALADPTRLVVAAPPPPPPAALPGGSVGGFLEESKEVLKKSESRADRFAASEIAAAAPMERMADAPADDREEDGNLRQNAAKQPIGGATTTPEGPAIAARTDFSALALFAPDVRTDASGRATVPLEVPDSLTRYRVMVVAADAGNRFGSADAAVTARLPLMVRPSAPRFLNFGDQVELPIVVQNQGDRELVVDVALRGTNVRFVDAVAPVFPDVAEVDVATAGRRVKVPAKDRVEVRFPAATGMAGTARFQVVVASGEDGDAANFELPVWTPATTEAFATYGEIDRGGIVQPVAAPPDVWTQFGGLEVTTSSTQLQALTDAVLYLESYPFDCNEQIASRVLGIASLRDVLTAFDVEGLPEPKMLERSVERDLERLAQRQHWNGGWSFWRKGDEPWPFLSIHVANAFARAKAKRYAIPEHAWNQSLYHLRNIESYIPWYYSQEAKWFLRAYALDVRRRMQDADPREAKRLYGEAGTKLGIDGLAFLLPTLHEAKAPEAAAILRHLSNNVTESAGTAHFVTSYSDGAQVLLHSDRRADGIVLEALMETLPSDPGGPARVADDELVAKVVRGLLAHKTKGRWGSTQENAFVLLALDRYFRIYEKETPDFVARVWLGEGYAGDHAFRGRTTERSHLEIPMGYLTEHKGSQPLTLLRDGEAGRLYYRVGLKYAPRDLRLEPADYGFAVVRAYEAVDDPGDVRRGEDGVWHVRAGARVRVKLEMATPMRRYHVALVDPLPAGLEAQNPVLATTGTLPSQPSDQQPAWWWWSRPWQEHENLRDERVEAFTSLLWDGVHEYSYVARATTPGRFVVPPAKAEEMYMPETFGRSGTDILVVE